MGASLGALPTCALFASCALLAACALPTDQSDILSVELVGATTDALVGDTVRLDLRVTGPSGPLAGMRLSHVSSDSSVVFVEPSGVMLAVGEGDATVTASLLQYENAPRVSAEVTVSRGVVINALTSASGRRATVRFSEVLHIDGRRLDPDSLAAISIGSDPVEVVDYRPADSVGGTERLSVLVPVAPAESRLLIVHAAGGSGSRPITIVQEDVLELDQPPTLVDLAAGPVRFPYLTIEDFDLDTYRLQLPAGDWTIDLALLGGFALSGNSFFRFEVRAPTSALGDRFPTWGREQTGFYCGLPGNEDGGWFFARRKNALGALVLPLRTSTPLTLDFFASTVPGFRIPYRLAIRPGYESELPPDVAEGNDFCATAYEVTPGSGSMAFNFDSPGEYDWYEVTVPGTPATFTSQSIPEASNNNSFAQAQSVDFGSMVAGEKSTDTEVDFYSVDATAGTLLDIDVRALGSLPGSEMIVALTLMDAAGTPLARSGLIDVVGIENRAWGSDARIRYPVPADGTYYLSLLGRPAYTGVAESGPHMFYRMHVYEHELAGTLTFGSMGSGDVDPVIAVLEQRSATDHVALDWQDDDDGNAETVSWPVAPGTYKVLLYNSVGTSGEYSAEVSLAPPPPAPAGERAPSGGGRR